MPDGFIERFGHVPVDIANGYWGVRYREPAYFCEFPDCPSRSPAEVDHCHEHGWVRGWICGSHNRRLGRLESVAQRSGERADISAPPWSDYRARCPGCAGVPLIRPRGRFSPGSLPPVTGPVALPDSTRGHLRVRPAKSICGRAIGHLDPVRDLPWCYACEQIIGRREAWTGRLVELANLSAGQMHLF